MQSAAWGQVVQKVSPETLSIYPQIKGIQVMNDMGDYMFRFIDSVGLMTRQLRSNIITTLQNWAHFQTQAGRRHSRSHSDLL